MVAVKNYELSLVRFPESSRSRVACENRAICAYLRPYGARRGVHVQSVRDSVWRGFFHKSIRWLLMRETDVILTVSKRERVSCKETESVNNKELRSRYTTKLHYYIYIYYTDFIILIQIFSPSCLLVRKLLHIEIHVFPSKGL